MANIRYQALGPLMAGEGSRAFLGLEIADEAEAKPVVLIWVPDDIVQDPARIAALEKETKRATQLIHPNIIRVYGLATVDDQLARVVDFADGETLRSLLTAANRLAAPLAALIVADAATGVYFAHEAGNDDGSPLVHGDLRPGTLMVSFNGLCTVMGYGALSVAPREQGGKRVVGRRWHTAPEQILGGRDSVTPQTDVFLLGLMLYECLTGQVPFEADADFDQKVLTEDFPGLDNAELIPPGLAQVIAKATAKKSSDRYLSALALREAIEQAQPLPPRENLEAYIAGLFPRSADQRDARRREIDAGIAEFARKQWADRKAAAASTPPAPASKAPSAAPESAARPAPRPMVRAVVDPSPQKPPSRVPAIVAVSAGALVLLGLWAVLSSHSPPPPPVERATPPPPPPTPPPPEVSDSGAADAAAEPAVDAGETAEEDAGLPPTVPPNAGSTEVGLSLTVEPQLDVQIDGQPAGRSPIEMALPPGKHKVTLLDKHRGINIVRYVTVSAKGRTREEIRIGRGYVTVSAPADASVFIDSRLIGKAPLPGEVTLFEGSHQILVTVGPARWQQAFTVRANEHAYFNVEAQ